MPPTRPPLPEFAEMLAEALCRSAGGPNSLLCRALGTQYLLDALSGHPEVRTVQELLEVLGPESLVGGGVVRRLHGALRGIAAMSPDLPLEEFARLYAERNGRGERRTG